MNLTDANILLTGGGRGLGRFLVEKFINENSNVGVFEKDPLLVQQLLAINSPRIHAWECDVSNRDSVLKALALAEKDGFFPQILINNAGLIHSEPLIKVTARGDRIHSEANWDAVFSANLKSVFNVTGIVIDRMLARRIKGVVVSISSIAAEGNAGQSAYSAAKAGVIALTRTWSLELGPLGYRFMNIAPGFMDTPSTLEALGDSKLEHLKRSIPLRRLGDLESFYGAVKFCIENEYMNGATLKVDGGLRI